MFNPQDQDKTKTLYFHDQDKTKMFCPKTKMTLKPRKNFSRTSRDCDIQFQDYIPHNISTCSLWTKSSTQSM